MLGVNDHKKSAPVHEVMYAVAYINSEDLFGIIADKAICADGRLKDPESLAADDTNNTALG